MTQAQSAEQRADAGILTVLRDVRPRSIASGMLSHVPGLFRWWDGQRPMGNTASAAYCRGIWQFHLAHSRRVTDGKLPTVVAELGPGATLGACIAALLDGVQDAVALDAAQYAARDANLRVLEDLAASHPEPVDLVALRVAVAAAGEATRETRLRYCAPWSDPAVCAANSVDFIFSHSVLEHVDDPAAAYAACYRWLRPGGLMSHKIDHSSHAITRSWNGHYAIPAGLWRVIFGRKPYLLNRWAPRQHLAAMEQAGFQIMPATTFVVDDNGKQYPADLGARPADDRMIRTSTVLAIKPA